MRILLLCSMMFVLATGAAGQGKKKKPYDSVLQSPQPGDTVSSSFQASGYYPEARDAVYGWLVPTSGGIPIMGSTRQGTQNWVVQFNNGVPGASYDLNIEIWTSDGYVTRQEEISIGNAVPAGRPLAKRTGSGKKPARDFPSSSVDNLKIKWMSPNLKVTGTFKKAIDARAVYGILSNENTPTPKLLVGTVTSAQPTLGKKDFTIEFVVTDNDFLGKPCKVLVRTYSHSDSDGRQDAPVTLTARSAQNSTSASSCEPVPVRRRLRRR